nr:hypothetical protein [Sphingomonas faeni]
MDTRTRAKLFVLVTSDPFDAMWTADDPMPKTPATLATFMAAPIGLARNAGAQARTIWNGRSC